MTEPLLPCFEALPTRGLFLCAPQRTWPAKNICSGRGTGPDTGPTPPVGRRAGAAAVRPRLSPCMPRPRGRERPELPCFRHMPPNAYAKSPAMRGSWSHAAEVITVLGASQAAGAGVGSSVPTCCVEESPASRGFLVPKLCAQLSCQIVNSSASTSATHSSTTTTGVITPPRALHPALGCSQQHARKHRALRPSAASTSQPVRGTQL